MYVEVEGTVWEYKLNEKDSPYVWKECRLNYVRAHWLDTKFYFIYKLYQLEQ